MSTEGKRVTLLPNAMALAADLNGEVSAHSLDLGIKKLQEKADSAPVDPSYLKHLAAVYESMATVQLMLLSLTAKEDTQMAEAVERMSIRCAALMERTARLNDVKGPKLERFAEEMQIRDQINERGIEPSEKIQGRDGREH
jgi:hypothetical protein